MTLKMKLTASISAFVLIIGLMLMGVFAVNQATVNMGGSSVLQPLMCTLM